MNFKWNIEEQTELQKKQAMELSEKLNISPILTAQLVKHGISTESAAKRFFRPQLQDLINPFLMKDMDLAVDRLNDAIGHKERILVYGDYDVDGCTAVTLVYKFLQQFYSNIDYYIPDRYDEGYGVSKKGIDFAKEQGVSLIIILDCGIKAHEAISYAKSIGIDFIPRFRLEVPIKRRPLFLREGGFVKRTNLFIERAVFLNPDISRAFG
jgi:single-stranded-DNA-specific exonuclease